MYPTVQLLCDFRGFLCGIQGGIHKIIWSKFLTKNWRQPNPQFMSIHHQKKYFEEYPSNALHYTMKIYQLRATHSKWMHLTSLKEKKRFRKIQTLEYP